MSTTSSSSDNSQIINRLKVYNDKNQVYREIKLFVGGLEVGKALTFEANVTADNRLTIHLQGFKTPAGTEFPPKPKYTFPSASTREEYMILLKALVHIMGGAVTLDINDIYRAEEDGILQSFKDESGRLILRVEEE